MTQRRFALAVAGGISIMLLAVIIGGGCVIMGCFSDTTPQPNEPINGTTPPPTTPGDQNNEDKTKFEGVELPDGVTVDNLPPSIAQQHYEYLDSQNSHTLQYSFKIGEQSASVTEETVKVQGETALLIQDNPDNDIDTWMDGSKVFTRTIDSSRTTYSVKEQTQYTADTQRVNLASVIKSGNYTAASQIERNGETFIVFNSYNQAKNTTTNLPGTSISNYSSQIILSPNGYIKGFSINYNAQIYGSTNAVSMSGLYSNIGSTETTEPEWVSTAQTEHAEVVGVRGDTYISLSHQGGTSVESGTVMYITGNGTTSAVTLDNSLQSGNEIYLYKQGNGFKISQSRPSNGEPLGNHDYIITGYYQGSEKFMEVLQSSDEEQ